MAKASSSSSKQKPSKLANEAAPGNGYSNFNTTVVPFLTFHDPDWSSLGKAFNEYQGELDACLGGLSRSLEVCLQSEAALGLQNGDDGGVLSQMLRHKIDTLSELMEQNVKVMRDLLDEFPTRKMLAEAPFPELSRDTKSDGAQRNDASNSTSPGDPPPRMRRAPEPSSYDSVNQIVAHLVRDWTKEGVLVRKSIYEWVQSLVPKGKQRRILIPGAGMGRLAWDIASEGHLVEANEVSLAMTSAAHKVFASQEAFTVHPFVTDFFVNEVESQQRYQAVRVHPPNEALSHGHLSYTLGDFVEIYGSAQASYYDTVITCFFLDTATNVMQYLAILSNILPKGGQWINIGPLQWHNNAQLHPAADELKVLIECFGFRIDHWSIDDKPVDYRMEDPTTVRFTKYEGYQPLRMVATKTKGSEARYPMVLTAEKKWPSYPPSSAAPQEHPAKVTLEHIRTVLESTTTIEELASDEE